MNILKGTIEKVISNGSLTLVYTLVNNMRISAIVIDTLETAPYLFKGNSITVVFKETEVIIGKGINHQISMQNRFVGAIKSIKSNNLLSKLVIDTTAGKITSIITTNAVKQLDLKEGDEVTAMIKTNEILLSDA